MTADEAATRLEEMLACQQGPIVHHCHDHHRAVELGEHIDAVLLELDRLRHDVKSVEADLRWTRALVRRLWRDGVEEPDAGPVGITEVQHWAKRTDEEPAERVVAGLNKVEVRPIDATRNRAVK